MSTLRAVTPVPWTNVHLDGGFWGPRFATNHAVTLPAEYHHCQSTGRLDAFRLAWRPGDDNPPHIFWESDVAKWLEAACYSLALRPDEALQAMVDEVVDLIVGAQQPDGYLNVHFTVVEPEKRWANLRDWHELYCAGHLMEAAVAHHAATGSTKLLDCLVRYSDCIGRTFGRGEGQQRGYCGHEEIELALLKLYRATGDERHLRLAEYFLEERGALPHYYDQEAAARGEDPKKWWAGKYDYCQAHLPIREQETAEGHSVRAMYLYCGMVDLALETGDETLLAAARKLWANVVERRVYLTGGIGSSSHGERFTTDFDLPNDSAYAETCAAIGLMLFAHRLLQAGPDGAVGDVLERTLYNGVMSGISLTGELFFYANPLAVDPKRHRGPFPPHRQEWFGCACCPPNIARVIASVGGLAWGTSADTAYSHLFIAGEVDLDLGGRCVKLAVRTNYPWSETVTFEVLATPSEPWALAWRVPGWCRGARTVVGETSVTPTVAQGYARLERTWHVGDTVQITLPMPVERAYARPEVTADAGKVALLRGPLVYCLEEIDNGQGLGALAVSDAATFSSRFDAHLLGGVTVLEGPAVRTRSWDGELYRTRPPVTEAAQVRAVPYALWQNRGVGEMQVWLQRLP